MDELIRYARAPDGLGARRGHRNDDGDDDDNDGDDDDDDDDDNARGRNTEETERKRERERKTDRRMKPSKEVEEEEEEVRPTIACGRGESVRRGPGRCIETGHGPFFFFSLSLSLSLSFTLSSHQKYLTFLKVRLVAKKNSVKPKSKNGIPHVNL